MSGAASIPLAFIALFFQGEPQIMFALLAFVGVWVFAAGVIIRNKKLINIHNEEVKVLNAKIGNIQEQTISKRQEIRNRLADYLLKIEDRAAKIGKMRHDDYAESIEDKPFTGEQTTDILKFRRNVQKLKDAKSIDLAAEVYEYIKIHIGEDKAKLFTSKTGMVIRQRGQFEGLGEIYADKKNEYVDLLNHWAKNLQEIIKNAD